VDGTSARPRLSVFRSSAHIYAQIIDDVAQRTLVAVSSHSEGVAQGTKSAGEHVRYVGEIGLPRSRQRARPGHSTR
jgi:large subunit ribosomal protein L18